MARGADSLDVVTTALAYEMQLLAGHSAPAGDHLLAILHRLPDLALSDGRTVFVADAQGVIVATTARQARQPRLLTDLFLSEDAEAIGHSGMVVRSNLRNGTPVIAAFRSLGAGHVAVVQPIASIREVRPPVWAHEAVPIAGAAALIVLGAGCLRYRRRAQQARQAGRITSDRFDASLAQSRCGVWDWDMTRGRVFWSTSMHELLGYEPRGNYLSVGELAGMLHPDDGGLKALAASIASPSAFRLDRELRIRNAAGEWRWLRIKGEAALDPTDQARHVVGLAHDVTAERQAAERRATDDRRIREALEAVTEAFVLWDAEERLILCNSKFLTLHGIPDSVAQAGAPYREVMAASRAPMTVTTLPAERAHEPGARLVETQLADGRWLHVSERRTRDGGTVSVGTDVSDLKRKEARLRARERDLQGSVRAAETAAQCYAAAAERNYEANVAKTEFLARMSHELRTPLTAIIGFSDAMRQQIMGPLDHRYLGYTAGIHASGVKLLETIEGILQMSQIEQGQFRLAPEVMLLEDAVQEAVAAVGEDIAAKGVTIATDIPGPALLQADVQALREVLIQLIRNAVKFSLCDGRVRIRVRTALGRINVFVEDAGAGISPDILPRLGRPFEQVESEYSRSCGGAGLGLAIARSLVEMHGGRLKLRSEPGLGTIAMLSLPKVQPPANDLADAPIQPLARALVAAE